MKMRVSLLVLALLPALGGTTLAATSPAICNLVKDPTGDAGFDIAGPPVPGASGDDIVSGDVATNATTLTTVVRVASLDAADPQAPLGRAYMFFFSAKGSDRLFFTSVTTYLQGTSYEFGYREAGLGGLNANYVLSTGKGVVDLAKKEVRMSIPLSALKAGGARTAPGTKIGGLAIETRRVAGQGVVAPPVVGGDQIPIGGGRLLFDDAAGKSYLMGTKSCVKPGK
jgi:hypothetical protein